LNEAHLSFIGTVPRSPTDVGLGKSDDAGEDMHQTIDPMVFFNVRPCLRGAGRCEVAEQHGAYRSYRVFFSSSVNDLKVSDTNTTHRLSF
jgi:hypothetical protein